MNRKLLIILSAVAFSKISLAGNLRAFQINHCDFWMPNSNGSGYLCANYPSMYFEVAEASSFATEIQALEEKIKNLELRLSKLEKK